MSRRGYSILVITLTIIYVSITFHINQIESVHILFQTPTKILSYLKTWNKSKVSTAQDKPKIKYGEVKQDSTVKQKDMVYDNKKNLNPSIYKMPATVKNAKLERIFLSEREVLKSIFNKTDVEAYLSESAKTVSISNSNKDSSMSKDEIPVFKNIGDKKIGLSPEEKEKLKGAAKKLSSIDQDKVNKYLESNDNNDIVNAIHLLKNRLSDHEYESIKSIDDKYSKK